jgi:sec-independent protein translocase protein TatC
MSDAVPIDPGRPEAQGSGQGSLPPVPPPASALPPPPSPPPPSPPRGNVFSRLRDNPEEGPRMTFLDHLMELRKRLWIAVVSVSVCVLLAIFLFVPLVRIMKVPMEQLNAEYAKRPDYKDILKSVGLSPDTPALIDLTTLTPLESTLTVMWIGIYAGLALASPLVLYQIWAFISPGLRLKERRAIQPILMGGIVFFILGVLLTYYILFPVTLAFVVWLDVLLELKIQYNFDSYMSLMMNMMWVSGLACETPMVVGVLAKLGIVKPQHLTQYWRWCVLLSFVLGAIFSPGADMMSMLVFSLLYLGLYVASVVMCYLFYTKKAETGTGTGPGTGTGAGAT